MLGSSSEMRATRPDWPVSRSERRQASGWGPSRLCGDRVAVRITFREAEFRVEAGQHAVGDGVFEDFGFVVDLVPAVAEFADEEGFEEAVAADHVDGGGAALVGEGDRAVLRVGHQALFGEFADRLRRRRRRHAQ